MNAVVVSGLGATAPSGLALDTFRATLKAGRPSFSPARTLPESGVIAADFSGLPICVGRYQNIHWSIGGSAMAWPGPWAWRLERFPTERMPAGRKNVRQYKDREPPAWCNRGGYGSSMAWQRSIRPFERLRVRPCGHDPWRTWSMSVGRACVRHSNRTESHLRIRPRLTRTEKLRRPAEGVDPAETTA